MQVNCSHSQAAEPVVVDLVVAGQETCVSGSVLLSSKSLSLNRLGCIFLRCCLFLLKAFPAGVSKLLEHGSRLWPVTMAGSQPRRVCMCMVVAGSNAGNGLAFRLWYRRWCDCKSCILLCTCCGVECFSKALNHGSVLGRALPINICAGVMFSPVTGVFLSDSSTRCGSSPVCIAFFSACFAVLVLSASPLDCGYPGLECVSLNSHAANDLIL